MAVSAIRGIMYMLIRIFPNKEITYENHRIQNIVSNVKISGVKSIDLEQFYKDYSTDCTYQSSIFPGLIFRPASSPIVLLVFHSCKIVVTGGFQIKSQHFFKIIQF
jgi:TATA-box binding protein (TBP) (component of TFIID and TFIIIB)